MEVSQIAGLDTHAVIGGGQAEAFTMSDEAEFFTILSSTLYSNKKRAVVREVVCNAWDAHIAAGRTDTPVKVTLTTTELVIQDFGLGIPFDKIGPIYCRYGASTKAKDKNQTGGFGLGSKAPFAYSDHFTVIDCHAGQRAVYAISRGGAETGGKPDFRCMVKVPTEETGLTVSIPLADAKDHSEFEKLVRSVAYQGGMQIELNGALLPTIDYEPARKQGFAFLQNNPDLNGSPVYVLYGTVVYPIISTESELWQKAYQLDRLADRGSFILVCPPDSIGVAPSREALSYTDKTRATLHRLMDRAIAAVRAELPRQAKNYGPALGELFVASKSRLGFDFIGAVRKHRLDSPEQREWLIVDPAKIALAHVGHNPDSVERSVWRNMTLKHASRLDRDRRRHYRRFVHEASLPTTRSRYNGEVFGMARYEGRLVLRAGSAAGVLQHMFSTTLGYDNCDPVRLASFAEARMKHAFAKVVFLGHNQREIAKEIEVHDRLNVKASRTWDSTTRYLAIVVPRSKHRLLDDAEAAFAKIGFKVLRRQKPAPKRIAKEVVASFYDLSKLKNAHGTKSFGSEPQLTDPVSYVRASGTAQEVRIPSSYIENAPFLVARYGKIAVALTAAQEARLKALGVPKLLDKMSEEILTLREDRDAHYALHVYRRRFLHVGHDWNSVAAMVDSLSTGHIEVAKFFFPPAHRLKANAQELLELVRIVANLVAALKYHDRPATETLAGALTALETAAKATFPRCAKAAAFNERWACLNVLTGSSPGPDEIDVFLDTVRFLERRHKRAAASLAPANDSQLQKEAA